MWQTAPGTAISICTQGARVGAADLELINMYCSITSRSMPFANVRDQPWQSHTFDISCQNPYLYHITLAMAAAHQRHLRECSAPSTIETDHLCKAISLYRTVISTPDPSGFPISTSADVRAVFAASTLLVAYLWCCPQDDIYTNVSVLTGSKYLVRAFWARPEFGTIYHSMAIHHPYWADIYTSFEIGEYRIPALEMLFPGRDIYLQENILVSAEAPLVDQTQVTDIGSVTRLAVVITVISSRRKIERRIFSMLVKIVFAWVAACNPVFSIRVKQKEPKAYMLAAYYFVVVWKVARLARRYENEPSSNADEEFIIGDDPSRTWWLTPGPRSLCKKIVDELGAELEEWLGWVKDTINELEGE
ncbi:hypothetical protein TWF694_010403 [Orbilia ellipsospora]|uniref:Uncharacterized protein n=1 Tax=Orbilia ellipsospora TaxID=2528407 RepID=A0AAV9X9S2_9PEZI